MKRRIFSMLLCCIMVFSLCSQNVHAEGQNAATCEHDYSQEVVSSDTLKQEGNCVFMAEYYYSCSICGEAERNDDHIFYGSRDFRNHKGPQEWIITDTEHINICRSCKQGYNNGISGEHEMNAGICTICGYKSQCVHANENHDEKCDYCGVFYIFNPYFEQYRSGDVIPIRYYLRAEEREGDWYECSLIDREGTTIIKGNGIFVDPSWGYGGCNMFVPENLEDDAYKIRVSLMRNDETEGEKEIWRSEVWVAINPDLGLVALDKTEEYSIGLVYDVGELFFNCITPSLGGLEQYSLVGGTGEGTINGTYLSVTKPGTFIVKASMPRIPEFGYDGGEATATLTVTCVHKDENKDHLCDSCGITLSNHSGGEATCMKKAVCDYCGNEYGDLDNSKHNVKNVPAKDATVTETGNKEYWHCDDCGANFSDNDGKSYIGFDDTVTAKLSPEIIEVEGQSITTGERKELTFRSNAAFIDFIQVEFDGIILDGNNYTVSEGSTIVTLKADYVTTLSAGEHTIGIVSTSGTATTTFTINANSPETGDNSQMALWIALFFVSGGLMSVTGVYSQKKKRSAR